MKTTNKGLLTPETLVALRKADRKLHAAFLELEKAAMMVADDVTGSKAWDMNEDALEAANAHPMYRMIWELYGAVEDNGFLLQKYLNKEESR